jgi:hypothetical protein
MAPSGFGVFALNQLVEDNGLHLELNHYGLGQSAFLPRPARIWASL